MPVLHRRDRDVRGQRQKRTFAGTGNDRLSRSEQARHVI